MLDKETSKVLLLDTNVSSYPIYQYLIREGYDVHVAGNNPNDFLAKCAKKYFNIDYSNNLELVKLINSNGINFLVPGCNDISYKACTLVNLDSRFPGIENTQNNETLNDKKKFRDFANKNGLPIPIVYSAEQIDTVNLPIIIKPTDSFSGKGITVITEKNKSYLKNAISDAINNSRSKDYVVEQFVSGQLHSHSAFLSNGEILQDFFVEENCIANPYAVDTSRIIYNLSDKVIKTLRKSIKIISERLNLVDGLIHTQFICNENSIWLIEPTRRCPGDLYSRLIELTTGFNYVECYTRPFLGLAVNPKKYDLQNRVFRHTITLPNSDNFWTFKNKHKIVITEYIPLALAGDFINAAPSGRIGIFFATSESEIAFNKAYQAAIERDLYETK